MNASEQQHRPHGLTSAGWWGRLFVAALFACYLNYLPLHLATTAHREGVLEPVPEAVLHHDGHDHADHSHDRNHHIPHPATDHTLTLTLATSAKAPSVSTLTAFFLPFIASALIPEPHPKPPIPVFERSRPPGESPPDPRQPRAPPLA